jgi:hypothetical protein
VRRVVILLAADASGPLLWLLVTSVFMLLRLCHLPQSGRHPHTAAGPGGRLLAPSAPFGGAQCQAAAVSPDDPLLAIVGGSDLDQIHGSLLPPDELNRHESARSGRPLRRRRQSVSARTTAPSSGRRSTLAMCTVPVMKVSSSGDQNAKAPQTPWWPTTCAAGNR